MEALTALHQSLPREGDVSPVEPGVATLNLFNSNVNAKMLGVVFNTKKASVWRNVAGESSWQRHIRSFLGRSWALAPMYWSLVDLNVGSTNLDNHAVDVLATILSLVHQLQHLNTAPGRRIGESHWLDPHYWMDRPGFNNHFEMNIGDLISSIDQDSKVWSSLSRWTMSVDQEMNQQEMQEILLRFNSDIFG